MSNKTHQISEYYAPVKHWTVTTSQMLAIPKPEIGFEVFNLDINGKAIYGSNGWTDVLGNKILITIFSEDFETGDFRNWHVANDNNNYFIVGTDASYNGGSYGAYITTDGTTASYNANNSDVSHFCKDIIIPTATKVELDFYYKSIGEEYYDFGKIYAMPTTEDVIVGRLPDAQYLISNELNNQSSWKKEVLDLSAWQGQTVRLVFSWKNDSSVGTAHGLCVDNIKIGYV